MKQTKSQKSSKSLHDLEVEADGSEVSSKRRLLSFQSTQTVNSCLRLIGDHSSRADVQKELQSIEMSKYATVSQSYMGTDDEKTPGLGLLEKEQPSPASEPLPHSPGPGLSENPYSSAQASRQGNQKPKYSAADLIRLKDVPHAVTSKMGLGQKAAENLRNISGEKPFTRNHTPLNKPVIDQNKLRADFERFKTAGLPSNSIPTNEEKIVVETKTKTVTEAKENVGNKFPTDIQSIWTNTHARANLTDDEKSELKQIQASESTTHMDESIAAQQERPKRRSFLGEVKKHIQSNPLVRKNDFRLRQGTMPSSQTNVWTPPATLSTLKPHEHGSQSMRIGLSRETVNVTQISADSASSKIPRKITDSQERDMESQRHTGDRQKSMSDPSRLHSVDVEEIQKNEARGDSLNEENSCRRVTMPDIGPSIHRQPVTLMHQAVVEELQKPSSVTTQELQAAQRLVEEELMRMKLEEAMPAPAEESDVLSHESIPGTSLDQSMSADIMGECTDECRVQNPVASKQLPAAHSDLTKPPGLRLDGAYAPHSAPVSPTPDADSEAALPETPSSPISDSNESLPSGISQASATLKQDVENIPPTSMGAGWSFDDDEEALPETLPKALSISKPMSIEQHPEETNSGVQVKYVADLPPNGRSQVPGTLKPVVDDCGTSKGVGIKPSSISTSLLDDPLDIDAGPLPLTPSSSVQRNR